MEIRPVVLLTKTLRLSNMLFLSMYKKQRMQNRRVSGELVLQNVHMKRSKWSTQGELAP